MAQEADHDRRILKDSRGLEKLLEHRSRLTILILLARHEVMNFRRLRDLLDETDGNLGAHLKRLEDAGLIAVRKVFEERKPVSWYGLEPEGRSVLERHIAALKSLAAGFEGTVKLR